MALPVITRQSCSAFQRATPHSARSRATRLCSVRREDDKQLTVGFLKSILGITTTVHFPDGMRDFICNPQPLAEGLDLTTKASEECFELVFGTGNSARDADILLRKHLRELERNECLNGQPEPLVDFSACWRQLVEVPVEGTNGWIHRGLKAWRLPRPEPHHA